MPRPYRWLRPILLAVLLFQLPGCGPSLSPPSGPLAGTLEERVEILSQLIAMEDRRWYQPLLGGRAAGSPDHLIRARTALSLGRLKDPEAAIYLPVLLEDGAVEVRREAAFASGICGDPRLVRFLVRALDDPDPETRKQAALALGRFSTPEAGEALMTALRKPAVSPAAALALFRPAFASQSGGGLLTAATEGHAELRKAALYALMRRPHPALTGELVMRSLNAEDDEISGWAARAAGIRRESVAIPSLVALLARESASVRVQALGALEKIGETVTLPERVTPGALSLTRDPHPGVALAAIRLLGRLGSAEVVQARLKELLDAGGRPAAAALTAIAYSSVGDAMGLVHGGRLPADVRLGAAEALPGLGPSDRLRLGSLLVGDPDPRVKSTALSAVEASRFPNAADIAVRLLSDSDLSVQASALEWSVSLRASSPAPELEGAWEAAYTRTLGSREADFQVTAVDALAQLGDPSRTRLEALLDHPESVVRKRAADRLVEKWGRDAVKGRLKPVETGQRPSDYVRMARRALGTSPSAIVRTDAGEFELAMDAFRTPLTADMFLRLSRAKFFDGLTFHRVVPDFVVQGGDPRGDGSGGPGYAIRDELSPVEFRRGTAGIALSGPDTGGSQWFVTLSRQPHLDGGFAAFAEVRRGLDVLDRIQQGMRIRNIEILGER